MLIQRKNKSKRVLLVMPFFSSFPANNPRATRWYYFVNHLIKNDFVIDVVTSCYDGSRNGISNNSFSKANLSIFRIKDPINNFINSKMKITMPISIENGYSKKKKLLSHKAIIDIFIRFFRFIYTRIYPDPYFFWSFIASLKIRELLKKNKYDFIISSGYPYSSHIAVNLGLMFINKNSIWIGDNGDPWSLIPYISKVSQIRKTIDRFIEGRILQKMNFMIVTNEHTKKGYLKQFKFLKSSNIIILPQGFDREKLSMIQPLINNSSKKLKFVYTGTFGEEYRNPVPLFQAIAELRPQLSNVEFYFAGRMSYFVLRAIQELQISDIAKVLGKMSYDDALRLQKSADILLLFGNKSSYAIPGKTYEYFGFKKPIFCIDYPNGLAGNLVKKYKRGYVCINQKKSISKTLKELIDMFNNNFFNLDTLDQYSWKNISEKLTNFLKNN